jgi:hypothetical protein
MEILVAVLVLGGVAALASYGMRRRRAARQAPALPLSEPRRLDQLRPGDVALLDGQDLLVCGVARLSRPGATWQELRLEDGGRERWMVVPGEEAAGVLVGQRIEGLPLTDPPSELLEHQQQVYRLHSRGTAEVLSLEGDLGPGFPGDRLRHWEYRCPGAGRLWLRDGEQGLVAFAGRKVPRPLVSALPGS